DRWARDSNSRRSSLFKISGALGRPVRMLPPYRARRIRLAICFSYFCYRTLVNGNKNPIQDKFEMIGEFFREAAVLVLVFVPVEKFIPGGLKIKWALATLGVSLIFLATGMSFERWRQQSASICWCCSWLASPVLSAL